MSQRVFDLIPSLTLMSDRIPLMHCLMPPDAAAAAWHGYKLKKLENGGKKQWLLQGDEGVAAF